MKSLPILLATAALSATAVVAAIYPPIEITVEPLKPQVEPETGMEEIL